MQKQFLLAAEADRIQQLIFRSSSLREVVGGSQLLSELCAKLPTALGLDDNQIITSAGGSFYLAFDHKEAAVRFGARLAEAYRRATGSSLSVAEPVPYDKGDYSKASKAARNALRRAKQQGRLTATPQIPYVAYCQSCGLGLAEAHERRVAEREDAEAFYLCPACRHKAAEYETNRLDSFLAPFYRDVFLGVDDAEPLVSKDCLIEQLNKRPWPSKAEEIARFDSRGYVAYIVADGDGMGEIFGSIKDEDDAKELSSALSSKTRQALATPIYRLTKKFYTPGQAWFVPALPLIMGGDDVFVLVPAVWALDIVRDLCTTFQKMLAPVAEKVGVDRQITMTAAVVFCKANYPYYLAHELGHDRLDDAKRMVKALAQDEGMRSSAVDFEIILGSQIAPEAPKGKWRSTLRPYWLSDAVPKAWGQSLDGLFHWRKALASIPARRRSQLRELLDPQHPPAPGTLAWDAAMEGLVKRMEAVDQQRYERTNPARDALMAFGGLASSTWKEIERSSDECRWHGHGLPDLLRAWDWTQEIDTDAVAYEGGR